MKAYCVVAAAFAAVAEIPEPPPDNVDGVPVNSADANAGSYAVPNPLRLSNGRRVSDVKTWQQRRRPEAVKLLAENQFCRSLRPPRRVRFALTDKGTPARGDSALRKQETTDRTGPRMDLLADTPANAMKPVPLLRSDPRWCRRVGTYTCNA